MIGTTLRGILAAGLLSAAALAALPTTTTPAAAYDYPWCGHDRGSSTWVCSYSTEAQCRFSVSGNGGFCMMNPSAATAHAAQPRRRRQ